MALNRINDAEKKFISDEVSRYIYDLREKSKRDWISGIAHARERGIEQGKEEIVVEMLKNGLDLATIQRVSKFSLEEIKVLKDELLH